MGGCCWGSANSKSQIADGEELIDDCEFVIGGGQAQTIEGELPAGKAAWAAQRRSGDVAGEACG